jgi:hypothetical protein
LASPDSVVHSGWRHVPPDVVRRWLPVVLGVAGTLLLAAGMGVSVQLALAVGQPTPRLRTVSQATLDSLGISLAPAPQMPFCGLRGMPIAGRLVEDDPLDCPISSSQAAVAAQGPVSRTVAETLLATVTAPDQPSVGQHRLAWLVVLTGWRQAAPAIHTCVPGPGGSPACRLIVVPVATGPILVVVDAHSAHVVATYWLGTPRPLPAGRVPVAAGGVAPILAKGTPLGTGVAPAVEAPSGR